MTTEKRFHPFLALRFLRKTLAVYLLPLINVLFERNWSALWTALQQDLIIFSLMAGISWVILNASSWSLDDHDVLHIHWKLFFRFDRAISGDALAALTIERPVLFRLGGASRVVLYPTGQPKKKTFSLCLEKEDAEELADRLLPIEHPTIHRPGGGERMALVLLGANSISTLTLLALAVRETEQLSQDAQTIAFAQLNFFAALAARWLPAGAAWLVVLAATVFGTSLLRSFAQTVRYQVWRTEDQIGSKGGWLQKFECRVRSSQISFADVRFSPIARLMRRWPVFVTAGCCSPELPLFVYRSGDEEMFRDLLPDFRMPPEFLADIRKRSLIFFAPAGVPFALCLLLVLVSRYTLPSMTPLLMIPTLICLLFLAGAWMGYRQEGIWPQDGRLTLRRQKGLYLHCICAFHPDLCLTSVQSPWAYSVRRTTLTLTFPGKIKLNVRSIPEEEAERCFSTLE